MAFRDPYCLTTKSGRNFDFCGDFKEGARVREVIFVEKANDDVDLNGTPAEIVAAFLTKELACQAFILRALSGTYDGGQQVTGDGRGDAPTRVTGKTHQVAFIDDAAVGNEDFYNFLEANLSDYNAYFTTETRVWPVTGKLLTGGIGLPISNSTEETIEGAFNFNWSDLKVPVTKDIDRSQLATNPTLPVTDLTATGGASVTADSDIITIAQSTAFDVDVNITGAEDFEVVAGEGDLPSWLSLDATTGKLTGNSPAQAESSTFTIKGSKSCGVEGRMKITVTVT